jgi:hypothetical protein
MRMQGQMIFQTAIEMTPKFFNRKTTPMMIMIIPIVISMPLLSGYT